ncbi:hypothetical protein R3P38DRAFT_3231146 [Favolaschia claudopus]|uniref:Uncharacterized protein n=1 Tax=Favolaschia claudopus TaxID=2862362 RepID=A0AAV9ZKL7_9AGAR
MLARLPHAGGAVTDLRLDVPHPCQWSLSLRLARLSLTRRSSFDAVASLAHGSHISEHRNRHRLALVRLAGGFDTCKLTRYLWVSKLRRPFQSRIPYPPTSHRADSNTMIRDGRDSIAPVMAFTATESPTCVPAVSVVHSPPRELSGVSSQKLLCLFTSAHASPSLRPSSSPLMYPDQYRMRLLPSPSLPAPPFPPDLGVTSPLASARPLDAASHRRKPVLRPSPVFSLPCPPHRRRRRRREPLPTPTPHPLLHSDASFCSACLRRLTHHRPWLPAASMHAGSSLCALQRRANSARRSFLTGDAVCLWRFGPATKARVRRSSLLRVLTRAACPYAAVTVWYIQSRRVRRRIRQTARISSVVSQHLHSPPLPPSVHVPSALPTFSRRAVDAYARAYSFFKSGESSARQLSDLALRPDSLHYLPHPWRCECSRPIHRSFSRTNFWDASTRAPFAPSVDQNRLSSTPDCGSIPSRLTSLSSSSRVRMRVMLMLLLPRSEGHECAWSPFVKSRHRLSASSHPISFGLPQHNVSSLAVGVPTLFALLIHCHTLRLTSGLQRFTSSRRVVRQVLTPTPPDSSTRCFSKQYPSHSSV